MQIITKSDDLTTLVDPVSNDYVLGIDESQTDLSKRTVKIPVSDLKKSENPSIEPWVDTTTFQKDYYVQNQGVVWISLIGSNLNNEPYINQDKWQIVAPSQKNITAINADVIVVGWFDYSIIVDATIANASINIGIPKFNGQKVFVQANGNFLVSVAGQSLANEICYSDNGLELTAIIDPAGTLKWDSPNSELQDRFVVAGVIRYYSSENRWDLIENQEGNHKPINIASIESDTSKITINYALSGSSVTTFLAVPDESMAKFGIFMGCSGGASFSTLELYMGFATQISYNGASWIDTSGKLTLVWDTDHLEISGIPTSTPPGGEISAFGPTFPQLTSRAPGYILQLGSVGANTAPVYFYDFSGVKVTTPDTAMKFFMNWNAPGKMDPNNFPDYPGNIWLYGLIKK